MGRAAPLDRDLVFTDARLAIAAARQRGIRLVPIEEARRILLAYPASGMTEGEIVEIVTEMIDATGLLPPGVAVEQGERAGGDLRATDDLPHEGTGQE